MERHCRGPECLYQKDKKGRDQVRCSICVVWHHIDCVKVKKDEMIMIWTCYECRDLSKRVKSLETEITQMKDNQHTLMDMVSKATKLFETESQLRAKAEEELTGIRSQMTALSHQLTNQHTELIQQMSNQLKVNQVTHPPNPPPGFHPLPPSAPPMKKLMIGNSILRNVDPNKLNNWEVIAKGGATVDKIHEEINKLDEDIHYSEMIIVCGSIDVESKEVSDIISDYQAMTVSASHKTDKIKICSVLPRTDKELKQKTKKLNDDLRSMCENDGHDFIDNDSMFHLMNGNVNEAYLVDGLHLSKHGVDSLLLTCGVMKEKSAFSPKLYPKPQNANTLLFRGHKHPLSNFFEVPIVYNGKHFKTSEAAYQHSKAETMGDHRAASKIVRAKTGLHAMKIGRKIVTDEQWKENKVEIMEEIIKEKAKASEDVRNTLTQSRSKEIIEDTDHEFWGRGKTGKGKNNLGKIWMALRKKIKETPNFLTDMPNQFRPRKQRPQPQRPLHNRPQYNRTPYRKQNWATRNRQPRCFQCGETGHGIVQCRKENTVSCWMCGLDGHKRKHCRYLSQQPQESRRHNYSAYEAYSDHYDSY